MPSIKSQITTDAIETDNLTYVKVAPYQTCKLPLIPLKNPSKQIEWSVNIGTGAIYNPDRKIGIYGHNIKVGYGSRLNGNIHARDCINLEAGCCEKGPTFILGSVSSMNNIFIKKPRNKLDDYSDGSVIINGNVYCKNIEILAPVIIRGNLIAEKNIVIKNNAIISGVIYSKKGKVLIKNATAYSIVVGNSQDPSRILDNDSRIKGMKYGLEISGDVELLYPFVWIKNDTNPIKISRPIRVKSEKDQSILLDEQDILEYRGGILLSRNWRSTLEPSALYDFINTILDHDLISQKNYETYERLFEVDEDYGYVKIDDTGTKIIHKHISQEFITGDKIVGEKVMGDKVSGDKISIKDSVVTRSQIGNDRKEPKDDGDTIGKKVEIKDSIVLRSKTINNH